MNFHKFPKFPINSQYSREFPIISSRVSNSGILPITNFKTKLIFELNSHFSLKCEFAYTFLLFENTVLNLLVVQLRCVWWLFLSRFDVESQIQVVFLICNRNDHHKNCNYCIHWCIWAKRRAAVKTVGVCTCHGYVFNRFIHLTPLFSSLRTVFISLWTHTLLCD